ncbi:avidin/streptavidin family protein [Endozoicomonas arenosclerae]|uniref:avidin/streptavidin family protein n=1 Tax=Endozoicomonas arenosclerae TaxID=1633495 RepID=UPI00078052FE|nr:avidin/streptavidin family protein [Endozoicomonas arenosclerae]
MKFLNGCVALFCMATSLSVLAASPTEPEKVSGFWKNSRGSILELKQEKNELSGNFTTAVAKTKTCIGYKAPFLGFANGNAISVSISMEGCNSPVVISMSGILMKDKDGKDQIKTQSLVQYKGQESWNSQILVTDYYSRVDEKDAKIAPAK